MGVAKIKTTLVEFVPIDPSTAPANSIYSDVSNSSTFSNKNSIGDSTAVAAVPDAFAKQARNTTGSTIAANSPVSRSSDGSIVPADSDSAQGQRPIGVTLESIAHNAFGLIGLVGRNISGACKRQRIPRGRLR